ncbi:periplasmic binding protein-like II [Anaeromyces robustus]|uniref:Periplasmic binding protein-like II n=1 Tax=Anaeromyces robustus TaxID=1754192 RepID=A0A1Y1X3E9_9FUNG|nr:periplasmic binding protein-like II [Anaeromyces robustus]|eukprot:ORX80195.1 periplasmic binding protein-like II [Anaeromyces robustus]
MNIKNLLCIVLFFININIIKAVTITGLALAYPDETDFYNSIVEDFNNYSAKNDIDVTLKLTLLMPENFTVELNNFSSLMDTLIYKKSNKYDIYFYYGLYTQQYGKYFLNLDDGIPQEQIDEYDKNIIENTCIYDNHIVGLPITIDIDVLYSNIEYLNKYNKTAPKTWDELIDTTKYILNEERKLNNNELTGFHGLIDESEEGLLFIHQLINSYRKSIDSPYPELKSDETKEALKMLKRISEEVSSGTNFSYEDLIYENFVTGNSLFMKYWYSKIYTKLYELSNVPGEREEITGSIISAYNVAINKYSKKENHKDAFEVMKYITSKSFQKNGIIEKNVLSAQYSLYDDDDVCHAVNCTLLHTLLPSSVLQLNSLDTKKYEIGIDDYIRKYQENVIDYLFHNKNIDEVIKKIDDLTKYYIISGNSGDSSIGFNILFIYLFIAILMILSLIYLVINRYSVSFNCIPKFYFVFTVIGSCIILSSIISIFEDITIIKCHLRRLLLSFGFIISLIPVLYKLFIYFPDQEYIHSWFKDHTPFMNNNDLLEWMNNKIFSKIKKISSWSKKHKFLFPFIFILIDLILNILLVINPYTTEKIITVNGENYQKCSLNQLFGKTIYIIIFVFELLLVLIGLFLIFIEWDIIDIQNYSKYIFTSFIVDFIILIVLLVLEFLPIKNYIAYYIILSVCILIYSIFNYIAIYGRHIMLLYVKDDRSIVFSLYKKENNVTSNEINNNIINSGTDSNIPSKISQSVDSSNNVKMSKPTNN